MSERNVLAACAASRDAYDTVTACLKEGDLSEQAKIIYTHIVEYYERDGEATSVDGGILTNNVLRSLSSPKHKVMFGELITSIMNSDVSASNVLHDFMEVRREAAAGKLASSLAAGKSAEAVRPLIEEYQRWDAAPDVGKLEPQIYRGLSAEQMFETTYSEEGLIRVWPRQLNDRLDGGLLRGHHVLIFARPEMGKTLMLVNMIAGFLAQDLQVLYVGNEDPMSDVALRVIGRLTGMTKYEISDDPATADEVAHTKGYNNLVMAELAPGTPKEIQALIDVYKPDVAMIDQLRNLNVDEEHFVQKLEKAATAARNLAKVNNVLMVSVTQAGDSASGKGPLDMGDVDSSNTGIPAQVDVMVGIGATRDDEAANRRVLSLPKNKRSGNHEFFPVGIDPQLSKIRSLT